jgi:hypothetical protein
MCEREKKARERKDKSIAALLGAPECVEGPPEETMGEPDYLVDPRFAKLPFTKLKTFLAEQEGIPKEVCAHRVRSPAVSSFASMHLQPLQLPNPLCAPLTNQHSVCSQELWGAGSKFSLAMLAEAHKVGLGVLLEELGPLSAFPVEVPKAKRDIQTAREQGGGAPTTATSRNASSAERTSKRPRPSSAKARASGVSHGGGASEPTPAAGASKAALVKKRDTQTAQPAAPPSKLKLPIGEVARANSSAKPAVNRLKLPATKESAVTTKAAAQNFLQSSAQQYLKAKSKLAPGAIVPSEQRAAAEATALQILERTAEGHASAPVCSKHCRHCQLATIDKGKLSGVPIWVCTIAPPDGCGFVGWAAPAEIAVAADDLLEASTQQIVAKEAEAAHQIVTAARAYMNSDVHIAAGKILNQGWGGHRREAVEFVRSQTREAQQLVEEQEARKRINEEVKKAATKETKAKGRNNSAGPVRQKQSQYREVADDQATRENARLSEAAAKTATAKEEARREKARRSEAAAKARKVEEEMKREKVRQAEAAAQARQAERETKQEQLRQSEAAAKVAEEAKREDAKRLEAAAKEAAEQEMRSRQSTIVRDAEIAAAQEAERVKEAMKIVEGAAAEAAAAEKARMEEEVKRAESKSKRMSRVTFAAGTPGSQGELTEKIASAPSADEIKAKAVEAKARAEAARAALEKARAVKEASAVAPAAQAVPAPLERARTEGDTLAAMREKTEKAKARVASARASIAALAPSASGQSTASVLASTTDDARSKVAEAKARAEAAKAALEKTRAAKEASAAASAPTSTVRGSQEDPVAAMRAKAEEAKARAEAARAKLAATKAQT